MNHIPIQRRTASTRRGFSLVEALVALLVVSFGMLALAGMQLHLSRNADFSKQHVEALRLAQDRIESLRSFTGLTTGAMTWNGLGAVAEVSNDTNTSYTTTTTFGGAVTDEMRSVNVRVAWDDRLGMTQRVNLTSVISRTDPRDPGFLVEPIPSKSAMRRPKDRNINIPIPAIDLSNGSSSYQFSANYVVVFNNISGNVVKICNPGVASATKAQILASSCSEFTGYVVAGYIYTPLILFPTGINHSAVARNTALAGQGIKCNYGNGIDQNSGSTLTNYKYYLCVVPLDTPFLWDGRIVLGGVPIGHVVCRYQYTQTAVTVNERNVQPYDDVNMSLDQQNYLIKTDTSNGPSSGVSCPSSMTVSGVSLGVVHQDCRNNTSACPAASP